MEQHLKLTESSRKFVINWFTTELARPGSIPDVMSQMYMAFTLYEHACKTVWDVKLGIGPHQLGWDTKHITFRVVQKKFS